MLTEAGKVFVTERLKLCRTCDFIRDIEEFVKCSRSPTGLSGICKPCKREEQKAWRVANSQCNRSHQERYRIQNREKVKQADRRWRQANPDTAWLTLFRSRMKHRDRRVARKALYEARKRRACPTWLSAAQHKEIQDFYTLARLMSEATGIVHHVDHIVPLRGRNVRGLHVPWNLQVLTATENRRKGNTLSS